MRAITPIALVGLCACSGRGLDFNLLFPDEESQRGTEHLTLTAREPVIVDLEHGGGSRLTSCSEIGHQRGAHPFDIREATQAVTAIMSANCCSQADPSQPRLPRA